MGMFNRLVFAGTELCIYRDDLNHPTVSGNKLHKLSPNIEFAKANGCREILSFGGPYSNHLHALAWACLDAGLSSVGAVRGELDESLTPTLNDCQKWGMKLIALPRKDYRYYQEVLSNVKKPCMACDLDLGAITQGLAQLDNTLIVPEGGSNVLAIESVADAYRDIFRQVECQGVTHVVCATGTGATLAGLCKAAPEHVKVIGMQAVAEGNATLKRINTWLGYKPSRLDIIEAHLGRFGKMPPMLLEFMEQFESQYHIELDPIYNGKAMLKLMQSIDAGDFKSVDKILFIHTGGLQGKRH